MTFRCLWACAVVLVLWSAPAHAEKVRVVASFSILGDMANRIAGDRIELTTFVGPESDAHAFQAAPMHAKALVKAKLFITNGRGFEPWAVRLMQSTRSRARLISAAPANLANANDPHAWQDIRIAIVYVENITKALKSIDRKNAAFYSSNAASYIDELRALDMAIRVEIAKIPRHRRRVITTHDAFGFLGSAYGIKFIAPLAISTEHQASAKEVASLIGQIRREKITAIFVENISDARLMRQIASETGLSLGGKLYSDALSNPGGPASTYIEMMRHNAKLLTEAMAKGS
jgi:zinc/manganese transport system substrate-binding protein